MSVLKDLTFVKSERGYIVEYKEFLSLLRQKHNPEVDKWKEVKKFNVDSKLKNDLITVNKQEYVSLTSVLKFAYQNGDILSYCRDVTSDVERHLLERHAVQTQQHKHTSVETVADLYKLVSQTEITALKRDTSLHFPNVESLYDESKHEFTENEWERILYFEYHFNKQHPHSSKKTISEQVRLKHSFLRQCQQTREVSRRIVRQNQEIVKERKERKSKTETVNGVYVKGHYRHLPDVIDSDLHGIAAKCSDQNHSYVFAVDCNGLCGHTAGLHIVLSMERTCLDQYFNELGNELISSVTQKHNDRFVEVVFVSEDGLASYRNGSGSIQRFRFFDDVCHGKLSENILHVVKPNGMREDFDDLDERCNTCFAKYAVKPLHWNTFDIVDEWYLGVPLQVQLILQAFFSFSNLSRSTQDECYVKEKLTRLYTLYDCLLNVYNRKHLGILQEMFTSELVYNYHNVTTVFSITSQAGITRSLKSAEVGLKQKSDVDVLYWDTYIKEHQLEYDSESGLVSRSVSLKDCFLILCLDNLVRLTFKQDPERGKSKSNQVCTLPITIKGLPQDSCAALSWHDDTSCNEMPVCSCKLQRSLGLNDFRTLILEISEKEEANYRKLRRFLTWSLRSLYTHDKVRISELKKHMNQAAADGTRSGDATNSVRSDEPKEEGKVKGCLGSGHSNEDDDAFLSSEIPFDIFESPPLIEKHPPPAPGRDDDIVKLKEILEDIAVKSGKASRLHPDAERILFAPDFKIGKNLLKLVKENSKFRIYLPEFPLLHLRKSRILNLCSAYKSAGLEQLLKYMHDDEKTDWMKLMDVNSIEIATRNIRRLSLTFHVVFMKLFMDILDEGKLSELKSVLCGKGQRTEALSDRYDSFLKATREKSPTLALHLDMMQHCDEIVAIYLAERIGGEEGYNLLLSAVKSSLPFAFVNGASSYGRFCLHLLHEHYSAGSYWQAMKMSLFSCRHKKSDVNIALDAQREMDHRYALKGFRPRASLSSVLPRMSLVDRFDDVCTARSDVFGKGNVTDRRGTHDGKTFFKISDKDISHIVPTVDMVLTRIRKFTSQPHDEGPYNIYSSKPILLPESILDEKTLQIGVFLMYKYAIQEKMFNLTAKDLPDLPQSAPKDLLSKVKRSKGITVQRASCKPKFQSKSKDSAEKKRQKKVMKMNKSCDCFSSEMNLCQAFLKPDCSKANVSKSTGIKSAISNLVTKCFKEGDANISHDWSIDEIVSETNAPGSCIDTVKVIVIEFAGIKFKAPERGIAYLDFIQNYVKRLRYQFPRAQRLVVCEEKYKYTPDDLKSATRSKRSVTRGHSISHLKSASDMLTSDKFDRKALTTTLEGKQLISRYLAENVSKLKLTDIILDVDSEFYIKDCKCQHRRPCNCPSYSVPIRATFGQLGFENQEQLANVVQRKGEAEMAQVDWVIDSKGMPSGETVLSVVTSGDIDALVIHLFAISRLWPRGEDNQFMSDVYLLLEKPSKMSDLYCVTKLIRVLERSYGKGCCLRIALLLCIGGNDFIPKLHGKSHNTVLQTGLSQFPNLLKRNTSEDSIPSSVNVDDYLDLIKVLYCPKQYNAHKLSLEEVRQLTIKSPFKTEFNSPDQWMPPRSALLKMAQLVNCQLSYLHTAGDSACPLPDFQSFGCLKSSADGTIEYDFGTDVRTKSKETLLVIPETQLKIKLAVAKVDMKRKNVATLQEDKRRKRRRHTMTTQELSEPFLQDNFSSE